MFLAMEVLCTRVLLTTCLEKLMKNQTQTIKIPACSPIPPGFSLAWPDKTSPAFVH